MADVLQIRVGDETFRVPRGNWVAKSGLVARIVEMGNDDCIEIYCEHATPYIMGLICEYMRNPSGPWKHRCKQFTMEVMRALILTANYLEIIDFLIILCQNIAEIPSHELKERLGVKTALKADEMRAIHTWAETDVFDENGNPIARELQDAPP